METDSFEVLGIGIPTMHYSLQTTHCPKRTFVDETGMQDLLEANPPIGFVAGGSCVNTLKALSSLGHKCTFIGKIGRDIAGSRYQEALESFGIKPHLVECDLPTAQAATVLTPEGTFEVQLVNSANTVWDVADLTPALFKGIKLVHIEGDMMMHEEVVKKAAALAKAAGAQISLNLASFGKAANYKKQMINLLSNDVHIIFANVEETKIITGLSPEQGCAILKDLSDTAVVKMGTDGCWAANGSEKVYHPALQVETVDVTGAGDLFTSGFLHGYLKKKTLVECVGYGTLVASHVVQIMGTEIPKATWASIKKNF